MIRLWMIGFNLYITFKCFEEFGFWKGLLTGFLSCTLWNILTIIVVALVCSTFRAFREAFNKAPDCDF